MLRHNLGTVRTAICNDDELSLLHRKQRDNVVERRRKRDRRGGTRDRQPEYAHNSFSF